MTRTLQSDPAMQRFGGDQLEPAVKGQRNDSLADSIEMAVYLRRIPAKLDAENIFHDQRQQVSTGLTADDRPLVTARQQLRDSAYMVVVHVGQKKRPDTCRGKTEPCHARVLGGLHRTTINQQMVYSIHAQLMARARHGLYCTVMHKFGIRHSTTFV